MADSSDAYELDLFAPELLNSPYRTYARLRANRGVHYRSTSDNAVQTVLSRYADVKLALTDPRFAVVSSQVTAPQALPAERMPCLEACLASMVARLLESLAPRASFDVVAEFAQPLMDQLKIVGSDFTADLIGSGVLALLIHRDQLNLMRNAAPPPATAVDELLRFESPVQRTLRKAITDVELPEGDIIEEGQLVTVLIGAANRDYLQFAEPDRLRLDRRSASRHLAFDAEEHLRAAAARVRLVANIAITDLMRALPNLQLAVDPPRRGAAFDLRRLESLGVLNGAGHRLVG